MLYETQKEIKFGNLWLFNSVFLSCFSLYLRLAHLIYHINAAIIISASVSNTPPNTRCLIIAHKLTIASECFELLQAASAAN